jgi:AraC-like DNA-binding protein
VPDLDPIDVVDIEDAERAISDFFLPVRLRPSRDPMNMHLGAITVGRVTVGRLRFGSEMTIFTAAPVNYHIDIPLAGRARSRAGKRDTVLSSPGTAAVFMPGEDVELGWSEGADQLCLMIDATDVRDELANLLGREVGAGPVFGECMDLRSAGGQAWMHALGLIQHDAELGGSLLRHRLVVRRLEQLLIDGLLLTHAHDYTELLNRPAGTASRTAATQAVDLLIERPEHPWTIAELAAAVTVSARSLHSAFRDLTNTTPMSYLQRLRLERAHKDLLAANPRDTTVSQVAQSWGFLHLSRFAAAYRLRFGESPVETLRKSS